MSTAYKTRSQEINAGTQDRALVAMPSPAADGRTLTGYFARWNEWTTINEGGLRYMERFAPGSMNASIEGGRMKVLFDHGMDPSIGRRPLGAVRSVVDDGTGALYDVELFEAPYVESLMPGLRAGVYGASFRFRAQDQQINRRPGKSTHNPEGLPEVTVTRAEVPEFGPTALPAYAGATAGVRSTDVTKTDPAGSATQRGSDRVKTLEELLAEIRGHRNRMSELDTEFAGRSLSPEARTEYDAEREAIEEKTRTVDELKARQADLARFAAAEPEGGAGPEGMRPAGVEGARSAPQIARSGVARGADIYDLSSIRSSAMDPSVAHREFVDRALRSIEGSRFPNLGDQDEIRSGIEALVRESPEVGRHLLATGSPAYRSAFKKTLMGQPLNGDEIRAMSLTGANGGFATLPYQLDPTIIKTGALAINPFREIARAVQIVGTNTWKGVSSGAVVASFDTEGSEVSDDSPTYAQPSITCYPARAFVPFSYELGEDYPNLLSDLGMLMGEAKDTLEANKFTVGTGTAEPFGIVTRATTTVPAGGTAAFAVADLYSLDNALPARFQANAKLVGNRAIMNLIRRFDTTNGNTLWGPQSQLGQATGASKLLAGYPLGYPFYQVTDMVSALTTGNKILIEGDFSQYVIVDRIGMSVELIPNLFGASGRPTGQRGIMAHWRVGADVTNAAAFRTLVTG